MAEDVVQLDKAAMEMKHAGRPLDTLRCMEDALRVSATLAVPPEDLHRRAELLVREYNAVAMGFTKQRKMSASKGLLDKALDLLQNTQLVPDRNCGLRLRTLILNTLAVLHEEQGQLEAAVDFLQEALEIETDMADGADPAETHLNVCAVLSKLGDHHEAIKHAEQALQLLTERSAYEDRLPVAYQNTAIELMHLERPAEALKAFQTGAQVASKTLGREHPITVSLKRWAKSAVDKVVANGNVPRPKAGARREPRKQRQTPVMQPRKRQLASDIKSKFPMKRSQQEPPLSPAADAASQWNEATRAGRSPRLSPLTKRSPTQRAGVVVGAQKRHVARLATGPGDSKLRRELTQAKYGAAAAEEEKPIAVDDAAASEVESPTELSPLGFEHILPPPVGTEGVDAQKRADAYQAKLLLENPDALATPGTELADVFNSCAAARVRVQTLEARQEVANNTSVERAKGDGHETTPLSSKTSPLTKANLVVKTSPLASLSTKPSNKTSAGSNANSPKRVPVRGVDPINPSTAERQAEAFLGYLSRMSVPEKIKPQWAIKGEAPPVEPEARAPGEVSKVVIPSKQMSAERTARHSVALKAASALWTTYRLKNQGEFFVEWSAIATGAIEKRAQIGELHRQGLHARFQCAISTAEKKFLAIKVEALERVFELWQDWVLKQKAEMQRQKDAEAQKEEKIRLARSMADALWDRYRLEHEGSAFVDWHQWQQTEKVQREDRLRREAADLAEKQRRAEEERQIEEERQRQAEEELRRKADEEEARLEKLEQERKAKEAEELQLQEEARRKQEIEEREKRDAEIAAEQALSQEAKDERRAEKANRRALRHYAQCKSTTVFYQWRETHEFLTYVESVLVRVRGMFANSELFFHMHLLRQHCIQANAERDRYVCALKAVAALRRRSNYHHWLHTSKEQGAARAARLMAISLWNEQHVFEHFWLVREWWFDIRKEQAKAKRVIAHWVQRKLQGSLVAWSLSLRASRSRRKHQLRALRHHKGELLWMGLVHWRPLYFRERKKVRVGEEALDIVKETQQEAAIHKMQERAELKALLFDGNRLATRYYRRTEVAKAFGPWHRLCVGRARFDKLTRIVMNRVVLKQVHHAMALWYEWSQEFSQLIRAAHRVLQRMIHSSIAQAFAQWRDVCARSRKQRALVNQLCASMRHAGVGKAFRTWRSMKLEASQAKRTCAKVWSAMQNGSLLNAWHRWLDQTDEIKDHLGKAEHAMRLIMHNRHLRIMHTWIAGYKKQVSDMARVKNMLNNLLRKQVFVCFRKLAESATTTASIGHKLTLVVGRLTSKRLSLAFRHLLRLARLYEDLKRKFKFAMRSMRRKELVQVMTCWMEMAFRWGRQRRLTRRSLQRLLKRRLCHVFDVWCDRVSSNHYQRKILRASIRHLKHQQLAITLRYWRDKACPLANQKRQGVAALSRWVSRLQAHALGTWNEFYEERCTVKESLSYAFRRCSRNNLSRALLQWYEVASHLASEQDCLLSATQRFRMQAEKRAFNRWSDFTEEVTQTQEHASRVLYQMLSRKTSCVLSTWRAVAQEREDQRSIVQYAKEHLVQGLLSRSLGKWLYNYNNLQECKRTVQTAVFKFRHLDAQAQRQFLRRWRVWCEVKCTEIANTKRDTLWQWGQGARRTKQQVSGLVTAVGTVVKRCMTDVENWDSWNDVTKSFPRFNSLFRLWRVLLRRSTPFLLKRFVSPFRGSFAGLSRTLAAWADRQWEHLRRSPQGIVMGPETDLIQEARRLGLAFEALENNREESVLHGWLAVPTERAISPLPNLDHARGAQEKPNSFHRDAGSRARHFLAALF